MFYSKLTNIDIIKADCRQGCRRERIKGYHFKKRKLRTPGLQSCDRHVHTAQSGINEQRI